MKRTDVNQLLKVHEKLNQTDRLKVKSHRQRYDGEWYINTIMVDGVEAPFRYKRKQEYQSLQGHYVNMTYYSSMEQLAGMEIQVMNVVRIRKS